MNKRINILCTLMTMFVYLFMQFGMFGTNNSLHVSAAANDQIAGKFMPPNGKSLFFIGQDEDACLKYTQSGLFQMPSGMTTYINLYTLEGLQGNIGYNGGSSISMLWSKLLDRLLKAFCYKFGTGPSNTQKIIEKHQTSVIAIGVYMTELNNSDGLDKITKGVYDKQIDELAKVIRNANRPVYLRLGYEAEGIWNNYDPIKYKAAWQYIVNRMRPQASNFVSVWQCATSPYNERNRNNINDWYPGDDFVDWCGFSYFLPGKQDDLSNALLNFARHHNKPVLICESTPQSYDINKLTQGYVDFQGTKDTALITKAKMPNQIWEEWFKPYFQYIHDNSDVIRGVAYINQNWDSQSFWGYPYKNGYWGDTRIQQNSAIVKLWNEELDSDYWLKGSATLFSQLGWQTILSSD